MWFIIFITVLSLILDGLLTNFLPYLVGNLSIYTTMFTVITVFLIYPLFDKNHKDYYIYSFILGIIYDLFYTNLFLYHGLVFLLLAYITILIYKNFKITKINFFLCPILIISLYEFIFGGMIFILNLVPITFDQIFYKIGHSLISNIVYGEIIFIIIRYLPKKNYHRKMNGFRKKN